ncbi:MAG: Response regulator [bacterium]|nr:Response regulator [bacterium]
MKRHRILVVEDDVPTLESLRDLFRRAGFEVATATTGRDALARLLDDEQPSVIVLDVRMPVMTGEELIEVIRSYRRLAAIPVLVLTAADMPIRGNESVDVVMRKPFRMDELVANVEALANRGSSPDLR